MTAPPVTARLGAPLQLGPVELRHRIVAAPMERNYCDARGVPTDHYRDRLGAVAAGGAALVYAEAAFVRADGRVRPHQLAVDDDAVVPGLRRLADAVHRSGALFGMQLVHGGRLAKAAISRHAPVAPSPVVARVVDGDVPLTLDHEDIADLVERHASAARRSAEAGADAVCLHAAHGYLLSQFLSPRTNRRTDEYADPARFLGEVLTAVRAAVPDLAVGLRISAFEGVEGGLDTEHTLDILARSGADGLDFVDVSAGCYEAGQWITPSGELSRGLHARSAARFRAVGPPVGVAGRIADAATAHQVVEEGAADFVTVGRALHADPGWPAAVLAPRRRPSPRPCIACNYCTDELRTGRSVGCAVNPDAARPLPPPSPVRPGALLVVGAGPAGLEAARRAAARGLAVRLVDRAGALGGTLGLAAGLREYPEYGRIVDWYAEQLDDLHVGVQLGVDLPGERLDTQPERRIVLATGARRTTPPVDGTATQRVRDLVAWLADGPVNVEREYVVWGADRDGVAVADHLAGRGARITLIDAHTAPGHDLGARAGLLPLARLAADPRVRVLTDAVLLAVHDDHVRVRIAGTEHDVGAAGPVLASVHIAAAADLTSAAGAASVPARVVAVGDAAGRGGWSATAVRDAAEAVDRLVAEDVA